MQDENDISKEYFDYSNKLLSEAFFRAQNNATRNARTKEEVMFETIWNFMQSRRIRRRNYMTDVQKNALKTNFFSYLARQYNSKSPLLFYFFDLPIKNGETQDTDLGEEIMLRNLENIAYKIESVYPYGAKFVVLSDGDIFSLSKVVPHNTVKNYIANINKLILKLGISRVSVVDWHTYIFNNQSDMLEAFRFFKKNDSYVTYLNDELIVKTRIRCKEIAKSRHSAKLENELLYSRAFFERNKKVLFNEKINGIDGFKLTKVGFKREDNTLSIFPADPNIEISVCRGITKIIKKPTGVVAPVIKKI